MKRVRVSVVIFGWLVVTLAASGQWLVAQTPLPDEITTQAFLETHFHLQDAYSRALCVTVDASCPPTVTTRVPCLTALCEREPATYSIAATFDTIQDAADTAQPGDLILIMPGRYRGIEIEGTGGEAGAYIHFLGWGEPGSVVVDAPARPDVSFLRHHFYFITAHHYIIENIAFEGAVNGAGIFISGHFSGSGQFAHHFIIQNVYSHDNGEWGLHTTAASYLVIQDSIFTTSSEEHGVYISGSGDDVLIRRNVFQDNHASGLQINADPQTATMELFYWLANTTGDTCGWTESDVEETGPATWHELKACYDQQGLPDLGAAIEDGVSERIIVEQNVVTGNGEAGGAGINLASVRHAAIRNNLIYSNAAAGIVCWDNSYAESKGLASSEFGCHDVTMTNNTVVDETGGRGALILTRNNRDMMVANNIIVRDRFDAYEITANSGSGLRSSHNYISAFILEESPGAILVDTRPDSGSIIGGDVGGALQQFAAPGFEPWVIEDGLWPRLNPNRPDFRLNAASPLLAMGDAALAPTYDLAGEFRTGNPIGALNGVADSAPANETANEADSQTDREADSEADSGPGGPAEPLNNASATPTKEAESGAARP